VDDLSSLLLSAIEETERLALAANLKQDDPEWYAHHVAGSHPRTFRIRSAQDHCPIAEVSDIESDAEVLDPTGVLDGEATARHIARNDPSSVLRRCAADKRTVELHRNNGGFCSRCYTGSYDEEGSGGYPYTVIQFEPYPCATLRNTAEGYGLTDHQEGEE
jgi:hypothetical protein